MNQAASTAMPVPAGATRPTSRTTLVDQVAADIACKLRAANVPAHTKLPSVRDMARQRGVSADTVTRAYDKLVALGHIEARRGSGFYVRPAKGLMAPPRPPDDAWSNTRNAWRTRLLGSALPPERQLGGGRLPGAWADSEAIDRALRWLGRQSSSSLLGYGDPQGLPALRQLLSERLADRGIETTPDCVLTTAGVADGISLILNAFVQHGQPVLVEDPGPFLVQERLAAWNLQMLPVKRLSDGPDLAELEAHCRESRPALFFLSSVLHNPTSSSLSPQKAFRLLQLAKEYGVTLVDDDSHGDLCPSRSEDHHMRLAALDQLAHTIYLAGFSKTLGAGLRSGFVAASREHAERLAVYRSALSISGSTLTDQLVLRLLTDGSYRHRCEQIRAMLDQRREACWSALVRQGFEMDVQPRAGMFVWARHPDIVDSVDLATKQWEQGVLLAPGIVFSVVDRWRSYLRFNVATSHREHDIRNIASLITQGPR